MLEHVLGTDDNPGPGCNVEHADVAAGVVEWSQDIRDSARPVLDLDDVNLLLGCDLEARRLDCSPSSRSVIGEDVDIPPPFSAAQVSAHPVDIHSRGRDCIKEGPSAAPWRLGTTTRRSVFTAELLSAVATTYWRLPSTPVPLPGRT
ncbi:MAG TPA: hypothetical protein VFF07_08315 [Actinomycetota bacterium]|nr:hypothetical protein [Actinomycetota bacterium]